MTRARVLIDFTVLSRPDRWRTPARFCTDLARGLVDLHDEWRDSLDLLAVLDYPMSREASTSRDLIAASEWAARTSTDLNPSLLAVRRGWGLVRAVSELRPKVVHLIDAAGAVWPPSPFLIAQAFGVGHLASTSNALPARLSRGFQRAWRFSRADVVVVASRHAQELLARAGVIQPARTEIVPLGIDPNRLRAQPDPFDQRRLERLHLDRPYVLCVGTLGYDKRSDVIATATAAVAAKVGPLDLAWAGTAELRLVTSLTNDLSRQSATRLRWLDLVTDSELGSLYRGAAALVYLPKEETEALPVLEAMAAGCPVIAARDGAACEAGGNAVLAVDPTPAAVESALASVMTDAGLRERVSQAGRAAASRRDRTSMARAILSLYRRGAA